MSFSASVPFLFHVSKISIWTFLLFQTLYSVCCWSDINLLFLSVHLSVCPCQVVGADAVTTVWSWQALVDAVKCSRGINTSEGRNRKWSVENLAENSRGKKIEQQLRNKDTVRNTIWARMDTDGQFMGQEGKLWWAELKEWSSSIRCIQYSCSMGSIHSPLNTQWTRVWQKRDHCG